MHRLLLLIAFTIIFDTPIITSQDYSPVILEGAHLRSFKSDKADGNEYDIYISLSPGYNDSTKSYTVAYMLDGWDSFGIQLQTYQALSISKLVPDLRLVAISYDIKESSYEKAKEQFGIFMMSIDYG